jgi:hypothetical protein
MQILYPTEPIIKDPRKIYIFLAGTIDNGDSLDWQSQLPEDIKKNVNIISEDLINRIVLVNPRRLDWDISWEQKYENDKFREQVNWELSSLEMSDIILMNFLPNSKSPITLLEFGLHVKSQKPMFICCPNEFYRVGNIDVTAKFYGKHVSKTQNQTLINMLKYISLNY